MRRVGIWVGLIGGSGPALAGADEVVAELRAAVPLATAPWEQAVRAALLGAADGDSSGQIEAAELAALGCATWRAVDEGVRAHFADGLLRVYGLDEGYLFAGERLGLHGTARAQAQSVAMGCLVASGDVAADLRGLSDGGSDRWDEAARALLLSAYDTDGDGVIGAEGEVAALPCAVWSALDAGVRQGWGAGLVDVYGFEDGEAWFGGGLGFTEATRAWVRASVAACAEVRTVSGRPDAGLEGRIEALPAPGSDAWDRSVRTLLLGVYDLDDDEQIDAGQELKSVSCAVWRAIDAGVQSGWGSGLVDVYGFAPGTQWAGEGIGVPVSAREAAAAALEACGVRSGTARASGERSGVAGAIAALPGGGTQAWDAAVQIELLRAYDADQSSVIDAGAEVEAIDCEVWAALDDGVRSTWPDGLATVYGFTPGSLWVGGALGLHEAARPTALGKLRRCDLTSAAPVSSVGAADADPIARLSAVTAPAGTLAWEGGVTAALRGLYDTDGSWAVDLRELREVPCEVWRWLDAGARRGWGAPLPLVLGLDRGQRDERATLGLASAGRAGMSRRIKACLRE